MNGSDSDHAFTCLRCMLVVFAQAPVTPLPRIRPLHDPTHRQRFEARLSFRTTHDLQPVRPPVARQPSVQGVTTIPGIREDYLQLREVPPAHLREDVLSRSGIVHVCCRHHHSDQKTQGIHENMALTALHLLAAVDAPFLAAQRGPDRLAVDRRGGGGSVIVQPERAPRVRRTLSSFCQVPSAFQFMK